MESYKLTCQEYELIYMGIAMPINAIAYILIDIDRHMLPYLINLLYAS